jgi:hypothetical protein
MRFLDTKITARQGDVRFNRFDFNAHNAGNGFGHFRPGSHT